MDAESTKLSFAAVGHQTSWQQIGALATSLRDDASPLDLDDLRELVPWIPPRVVMRARFHSRIQNHYADGAYIETFIDPTELDIAHLKKNVAKVHAAISCIDREHIPLTTLGGFTSIIAESETFDRNDQKTCLTTGNTLTTYFATQGVIAAAEQLNIDLSSATLGVIGASGDIGTACVRILSSKVKAVLVSARNRQRLVDLQRELPQCVHIARDNADLAARSDVIIAAASMTEPELDLRPHRQLKLVCDVGYPKNVRHAGDTHVFWGGLGFVEQGWHVISGVPRGFYEFQHQGVLHGCLLEAVVLALEGLFVAYSRGRGKITAERTATLGAIAEKHGIVLAPFMNNDGLWGSS